MPHSHKLPGNSSSYESQVVLRIFDVTKALVEMALSDPFHFIYRSGSSDIRIDHVQEFDLRRRIGGVPPMYAFLEGGIGVDFQGAHQCH
jgi:hypothetical protein